VNRIANAVALSLALGATFGAAPVGALPASPKPQIARITHVDSDRQELTVALYAANGTAKIFKDGSEEIAVHASHLGGELKDLREGDQGEITWIAGKPDTVNTFKLLSRQVDWPTRWKAIGGALAILLILAGIATRADFLAFVTGADNRYSKSQFQLVLWSAIVLTAYLATIFLRLWAHGLDLLGGIAIPTNLLLLSGFSAVTYGAAKAITVSKTETPGLPRKTLGQPRFSDLFRDDMGNVDFGDFQMVLITLIAATIYFWEVFHFQGVISIANSVSLPDVDSVLLSTFGLGQGAYLVKKLALPVGQG